MAVKKEAYKFTVQFNSADPMHRRTADMLNRQGRRKAQFIVNAVMHYMNSSEAQDVPKAAPVDVGVIEAVVRRILKEGDGKKLQAPEPLLQKNPTFPEFSGTGSAGEVLDEEGMAAIAKTIASFRR